jgi:MtN3 and saliva related transmembrane protein
MSTVSFAPQAWQIIRSRETNSISAPMYALTVTAFSLWLCYGILKSEWPLVVSNSICLALSSFILWMKLLPQEGKDAVGDFLDPPQ